MQVIRNVSKRNLVALAGLLTLSGVVTALCAWRLFQGYTPLPFSELAWRSATAETRGYMVKDLLASRDLRGLSEAELFRTLGEPDSSWTVEQARARDGQKFSEAELQSMYGARGAGFHVHAMYRLGYMGHSPNRPFSFPWTLHVLFRDGRVSRLYIDD